MDINKTAELQKQVLKLQTQVRKEALILPILGFGSITLVILLGFTGLTFAIGG